MATTSDRALNGMRRVLCVLVLALLPFQAAAACRQALAIGLDISGSVDEAEYRLQLDGLASALLNPDVQKAFLAIPGARRCVCRFLNGQARPVSPPSLAGP